MKSIRVSFENGNTLTTDINGTDEEIRAYYIGQPFDMSIGDGPEIITRAVSVKFLEGGK